MADAAPAPLTLRDLANLGVERIKGVGDKKLASLHEVGVDATWTSYDHPEHGYVVPERRGDGTWADREGSRTAIEEAIAFLRSRFAR